MRLYSKRQVALFTLAGAALATLVALGTGLVRVPEKAEDGSGTPVSAEMSDGGGARQGSGDFHLLTNASPVGPFIPAGNSDQYTEDEKVNIRVYELRNEGVVNITTAVLGYNWFLEIGRAHV